MNGYVYNDLIGRTGQSLVINLDGKRTLFRGEPATPSVLKINGEEKPASTVIESGDVIDFTPARAGVSAVRTLEELLGADGAAEALVNGLPAAPDRLLQTGDEVRTHAVVPVAMPQAAPENVEVPFAADAGRPEMPVEHEELMPEQGAVTPAASDKQESMGVPGGQRMFFLNGRALVMPAKPNNEPYYLMDMLDCSGIDFEHLEKRVILQVNGAEGQFTQILQDGDAVVIRTEG